MGTDPIPISAAKYIAKAYGYDQVIIVARKVGATPSQIGECVTTYGKDKANCTVAANIGKFLKHKVMGWLEENEHEYKSNGDGVEISRHPRS